MGNVAYHFLQKGSLAEHKKAVRHTIYNILIRDILLNTKAELQKESFFVRYLDFGLNNVRIRYLVNFAMI